MFKRYKKLSPEDKHLWHIIAAVGMFGVVGIIAQTYVSVTGNNGLFPESTTHPSEVVSLPTRQQLLKLVNAERAKINVPPLVEDSRLDRSAQLKADDLIRNNYTGHVDVDGKHGYSYITDVAGKELCVFVSENLAWTTDGEVQSAKSAVKWWMQSPPHRSALLNMKYTLTGFGIKGNQIVEHFCQER